MNTSQSYLSKITTAFNFALIFLILIGLNACNSNAYHDYQKMETLSWTSSRIIEFEIPISDTKSEYDLIFALRHIPEIPYQALEVVYTMYTPSGEARSMEKSIVIKDLEGNLYGKGMGDLFDLEVPLRTNYRFREEGVLIVEFQNIMPRTETLGIIEVGIIMKKSD